MSFWLITFHYLKTYISDLFLWWGCDLLVTESILFSSFQVFSIAEAFCFRILNMMHWIENQYLPSLHCSQSIGCSLNNEVFDMSGVYLHNCHWWYFQSSFVFKLPISFLIFQIFIGLFKNVSTHLRHVIFRPKNKFSFALTWLYDIWVSISC